MSRYGVGGHNVVAGAAAQDRCLAALWNPHASRGLTILHVEWSESDTGVSTLALVRISTRGTPGSTVTPDADNDYDRLVAPQTGALLDLGDYSVQPTVQGPYPMIAHTASPVGSGMSWSFSRGLFVPAGTGLAIVTGVSFTFDAGDSSWTFDD